MIKIDFEDGYAAREWLSKDGNKHNVYLKGSSGEIGWLDLTKGKFHNKSSKNYGFVEEEFAVLKVIQEDSALFIGVVDDDISVAESPNGVGLTEANEALSEALEGQDFELELNLGPSREIRKSGKSMWAKANLTIRVKNPENIEKLYEKVSDLAFSMLDSETNKLLDDRQN